MNSRHLSEQACLPFQRSIARCVVRDRIGPAVDIPAKLSAASNGLGGYSGSDHQSGHESVSGTVGPSLKFSARPDPAISLAHLDPAKAYTPISAHNAPRHEITVAIIAVTAVVGIAVTTVAITGIEAISAKAKASIVPITAKSTVPAKSMAAKSMAAEPAAVATESATVASKATAVPSAAVLRRSRSDIAHEPSAHH